MRKKDTYREREIEEERNRERERGRKIQIQRERGRKIQAEREKNISLDLFVIGKKYNCIGGRNVTIFYLQPCIQS